MIYNGHCFCGNIKIEFETKLEPTKIKIRSCQCSFCVSHQAATATDTQGSVKIIVTDRSKLSEYQFNLKTANYLICAQCNQYAGAVLELDGKKYSTINMRLFPLFEGPIKDAITVSYEDESKEERIKRRVDQWTPTIFAN